MGTVTVYPFTVYLPRYACWRKYVQALTVQLRSCPHCRQASQGLSPPKLQNARCTPTGKILISREENPTSPKSSKGLGFSSSCIGADTPDSRSTSSPQVALVDPRDTLDQQSCQSWIDNGTVEQYEILSIDPNCPRHGKFSRTAWLRKQQGNSVKVKPLSSAEAVVSTGDQQIALRPNDRQLPSEAPPSAVKDIDNLIHGTDEEDILLDSEIMDFLHRPELYGMEKELLEKQKFWESCDAEPATDHKCEMSAGEENAKLSEQVVEKVRRLSVPNMSSSNQDLCTTENVGCKGPLTDVLMSSGNLLPSDCKKEEERILSVVEPVYLKSPPPSCKKVAKERGEQKVPLTEQVAVVHEDIIQMLPIVDLAEKEVERKAPLATKTEIQTSPIAYCVNKKVEYEPPPSIAFGLQHVRDEKRVRESVESKGPTHTVVLRREIATGPDGKFVTKVVESKVPLQDTPACQPPIVAETDRKRRLQIHEVPLNGTVSALKREFENTLAEKVESNIIDRKVSLSETPLQNRVGEILTVAKVMERDFERKPSTVTTMLRRDDKVMTGDKVVSKVAERQEPLMEITPPRRDREAPKVSKENKRKVESKGPSTDIPLFTPECEVLTDNKVVSNVVERKEPSPENRPVPKVMERNLDKQPSVVTNMLRRDDKTMAIDKVVSKVTDRKEHSTEMTLPRRDREHPKVSKEVSEKVESNAPSMDILLFTPEGEVRTDYRVVSKVVERKEPSPETVSHKQERESLNVTKDVNKCKDLPSCTTLLTRESEVPSRAVERKEPLMETNFLRRKGAPLTLENIKPQKFEPLRETVKREGDILGMGKVVNKKSENKMPGPKTTLAWMEHEPPGVGKNLKKRVDIKAPVHEKILLEKQVEPLRDDIIHKKETLLEPATEITVVKVESNSCIQISMDKKGENTAVGDAALLPETRSVSVSQGDATQWKRAPSPVKPEESMSLDAVVFKKVEQKTLQTPETQNNLVILKKLETTCLELERSPPDRVSLRQGEAVQRKEAAEWMLNNAIEGALNKMANDGSRVRTLVEAFESIMSLSDPSEKLKEGEKFLAEVKCKSTLHER